MAGQLGITPEQLDNLFKYANGEMTLEEFKGLTADDETSSETEAGEGVISDDPITENENTDCDGVSEGDVTHNDPNMTHGDEVEEDEPTA